MAGNTAIVPMKDIVTALATPEWQAKIRRALPSHVKPERMLRVIQTALSRNPSLASCTKVSLFGAIVTASQLGLEVNTPMGHAYLVPFRNKGQMECQLIIGYMGYIDLAWRSDRILDIYAEVVREGDEFLYEMGLERKLVHRPKFGNKKPLTHVYAVCNIKGGGRAFVVLDKSEVMQAKSVSKSPNTVWNTENEPAMWKKTAVRQLRKWIPQSVEFATAAALDEAAERGESQVFDTQIEELDRASADDGRIEAARTRAANVRKQVEPEPPDEDNWTRLEQLAIALADVADKPLADTEKRINAWAKVAFQCEAKAMNDSQLDTLEQAIKAGQIEVE